MGNCLRVSDSIRSSTRMALTVVSVVAIYSCKSTFGYGLDMTAASSK
jgi:hypothetical protein